MRMRFAAAMMLSATAAAAQPVQPQPAVTAPVGDLLASSPKIILGDGALTMEVRPPDPTRGFYRGTRFDQAGVVTSLRLKGRDFYGPWFERTAPQVLDYVYVGDQVVAGPDSAISGPVEEFAPVGFTAAPGTFVKIGVGVLRQPDSAAYDHYRHYEITDGGKRDTRITKNAVTFTQALTDAVSGVSYVYEKTLTLVPGTAQMTIDHVLKNTGGKAIDTTVYDHNFLKLVRGNGGIRVDFAFPAAPAGAAPADLVQVSGHSLTYLRPMTPRERLSLALTGYGATAADYDFRITDTAGGAGVHMVGDAPLTRVNTFAIDRVQAVEPTIAIHVPPGGEQHWRYTYTYTVP